MMEIKLRDMTALIDARRLGKPVDEVRADQVAQTSGGTSGAGGETSPTNTTSTNSDIAGFLDALKAVIPVGLITLYTSVVLVLQKLAIAIGADDRANEQKALADRLKNDPAALKKALKNLTDETTALVWLRVGFLLLAVLGVAFVAFYTANKETSTDDNVVLEPLVVSLAFLCWALASPGTVLAAFLSSTNLAVWTLCIAGGAAFVLAVLGLTVLKKPVSTS